VRQCPKGETWSFGSLSLSLKANGAPGHQRVTLLVQRVAALEHARGREPAFWMTKWYLVTIIGQYEKSSLGESGRMSRRCRANDRLQRLPLSGGLHADKVGKITGKVKTLSHSLSLGISLASGGIGPETKIALAVAQIAIQRVKNAPFEPFNAPILEINVRFTLTGYSLDEYQTQLDNVTETLAYFIQTIDRYIINL